MDESAVWSKGKIPLASEAGDSITEKKDFEDGSLQNQKQGADSL
jgi:hypothetical protein